MIQNIKFSKLYPDAIAPTRKNSTDAGLDFYSYNSARIYPNCYWIIKTGITLEIPEKHVLLIKPKGKSNYLIGSGVIDAFYQPGEILIKIFNPLNNILEIDKGDCIAQGILISIEIPTLIEVSIEELSNPSNRSKCGGIIENNCQNNKQNIDKNENPNLKYIHDIYPDPPFMIRQ